MTGWDGFAKYVGVQGVLAVLIFIAIATLLLMNRIVPVELWAAFTFVTGFYFGKNGRLIVQDIQAAKGANGG